jgi:pyruvate formate lyase activating enzyme
MARDPIEKKPLYHYRPGSLILSLGFAGCNLRCPFCQNWHISQQTGVPGRRLSPQDVVALAGEEDGGGGSKPSLKQSFKQIAYTYSEPLVHPEFLLDCMAAAREAGIANVLVSNGCIDSEAAGDILALTDAANIDLKCFSEDTYKRILGGDLGTVLDFIRETRRRGVHLEITTLIVPGLNDGPEETGACAEFIAGLSRTIPWHLSAYHPDYRWDAPPTEPAALFQTARRARQGLSYVYTGNVSGESAGESGTVRFDDTPCPHCGRLLVRRRGYRIDTGGLRLQTGEPAYHCAHCGGPAPIRAN